MASSHAEVMSGHGDVERLASDLSQDLAVVSGLPSEIATCWRRALVSIRNLPADRPLRLQDAVRHLGADIRSLTDASPEQRAGLALSIAGRFSALRADVASAESVTQPARIYAAGDAALWNAAAEAMRRAGTRLLTLVLAVR